MPADIDILQNKLLRKLVRKYSGLLGVYVFDSGPSVDPDVQIPQFAKAASKTIRNLLTADKIECVGFGWGKTVKMVVDDLPKEPAPNRRIWFIPTCGDALGSDSPESSSQIAKNCDKAINLWVDDLVKKTIAHESMRHVSLRGVPDRIHVECSEAEKNAIVTRLIWMSPGWRHIFGEKHPFLNGLDVQPKEELVGSKPPVDMLPFVDNLDVILTSGALIRQPDRDLVAESYAATGISKDVYEIATHDFGGILFHAVASQKSNPATIDIEETAENERRVAVWNANWTGISLAQYKECVVRACQRNTPGVVMVAIGSGKAWIVLHALESKLVNTLIIDQSLAEALDRDKSL